MRPKEKKQELFRLGSYGRIDVTLKTLFLVAISKTGH